MTMQQVIERRLAVMQSLAPGEPMPGARARMEMYDSLPKEVRQVVANLDRCPSQLVEKAYIATMARKPVKTIVRMLQNKSNDLAGSAARDIAAQELKELGL